jgi:hypothetical protein
MRTAPADPPPTMTTPNFLVSWAIVVSFPEF